jgi:hypothetical protein
MFGGGWNSDRHVFYLFRVACMVLSESARRLRGRNPLSAIDALGQG